MDVKTSRLKIFAVFFVIFVVVGAGLSIRSSHFAGAQAEDCQATAATTIEGQVDALAPEAMRGGLACEQQ